MDFILERLPSSMPAKELAEFGWNSEDKSPNMAIMASQSKASVDGLQVCRKPAPNSTDGIRAKRPLSTGLHIWEIRWAQHQRGTYAAIGVGTAEAPLQADGYTALLGAPDGQSFGWDIVSRKCRHAGQEWDYPKGAKAKRAKTIPDRLFCILDMQKGTLAFATQNEHLGIAFHGIFDHLPRGTQLFPMVATVWGSAQITIRYRGSPKSVDCFEEEEMDDQLPELGQLNNNTIGMSPKQQLIHRLRMTSPVISLTVC